MKWFRYLTNGRRSLFIRAILRELGHKFVFVWHCIVEVITEKYERQGNDFSVTLHLSDWLTETHLHSNAKSKLLRLIELAATHGKVEYKLRDEHLTIVLVEITEIADEYTKKVQRMSGQNIDQKKGKGRVKEKEKLSSDSIGIDNYPTEVKIFPEVKKTTGKSNAVWLAYSEAMKRIHGVEPERNVKVNSLLCKIIDRVGEANALLLVHHYVGHSNKFYASRGHQLDFALRDAEALMLEIKKGKPNDCYQYGAGTGVRTTSVRTGNERQIQQGEIGALRSKAMEAAAMPEEQGYDNDTNN